MTRDNVLELVRNLLFESGTTTGLGTQTELEQMVDVANKRVWAFAVLRAPSAFEVRSPEVPYVASNGSLSLLDLDDGGVREVRRVFVKTTFFPAQDPWIKLEKTSVDERHLFGYGLTGGPFLPRGYYIEGENLYLTPTVTTNQTLQIVFIPNVTTLTASEEVIGGVVELQPFHPLVAYEAALLLGVKDEANLSGIKLLRDEMKQDMLRHLSSRRLRSIREVPFA